MSQKKTSQGSPILSRLTGGNDLSHETGETQYGAELSISYNDHIMEFQSEGTIRLLRQQHQKSIKEHNMQVDHLSLVLSPCKRSIMDQLMLSKV